MYHKVLAASFRYLSDKDVVQQLFGDEPVRPGGVEFGSAIQPVVDGVQLLAEIAAHVEPPVADEDRLRELGAVGAEEGGLAAIDVAVVPRLAPRVHVREEPGVRLVVAVEVRVRNQRQDRVVGAWPPCNMKYNLVTSDG